MHSKLNANLGLLIYSILFELIRFFILICFVVNNLLFNLFIRKCSSKRYNDIKRRKNVRI